MEYREFADMIRGSRHIVFFGGAGVSTESGLKDYRSPDGIYKTAMTYGAPPEELLSHDCFMRNPQLFYRFYRDYFMTHAEPNATHRALARLEQLGYDVTIVTQNIDGLHQAAGSSKVYELHGTTSRLECPLCGRQYGRDILERTDGVPRCVCGAPIKPHVVLYGEQLDDSVVTGALRAISDADLLIIGGTSLAVQPAASFVLGFRGSNIVMINKQPTQYDRMATLVFHESLEEVFREVMCEIDV